MPTENDDDFIKNFTSEELRKEESYYNRESGELRVHTYGTSDSNPPEVANSPPVQEAANVNESPSASDAVPVTQPQPTESENLRTQSYQNLAAKGIQSLTFGFGADILGNAGVLSALGIEGWDEPSIRKRADIVDQNSPFTSLAIDVAGGIAGSAALVATAGATGVGAGVAGIAAGAAKAAGILPKIPTAFNTLKTGAAAGAGWGALSGAGSGGSIERRIGKAAEGAAWGAAGTAIANSVVKAGIGLGKTALAKISKDKLFSATDEAAKQILRHIDASGKSLAQVQQEMAEKGTSLADVVPSLRTLVASAQKVDTGAINFAKEVREAREANTVARLRESGTRAINDMGGIFSRIEADHRKIKFQMEADYADAYASRAILTDDILGILNNPITKTILKDVDLSVSAAMKAEKIPNIMDLNKNKNKSSAKFSPEKSAFSYLDEVQKELGRVYDANKGTQIGHTAMKLSNDLSDALKKQPSADPLDLNPYAKATKRAEMLGRYQRSLDEAQMWGEKFATGTNAIDIAKFNAITDPLQKVQAQYGFVKGLNRTFFENAGSMSNSQLANLKTAFTHPSVEQLLPKKTKDDLAKMVEREVTFRKNADQMLPKIDAAEIAQNKQMDGFAYGINKLMGGAIGTAMKLSLRAGMSDSEAKQVIALAATEKGMQEIINSGKFTDAYIKQLRVINAMSIGFSAASVGSLAGLNKQRVVREKEDRK